MTTDLVDRLQNENVNMFIIIMNRAIFNAPKYKNEP